MTPEQISLIKKSWEPIQPVARQAAEVFYRNLFSSEPLIRHMFKSPIEEQAQRLSAMLGYVIQHLEASREVETDLIRLGGRHAHYGAQPEHYTAVGECMLQTLSDALGEQWTPELKEAWSGFLRWIFKLMQQGQDLEQH